MITVRVPGQPVGKGRPRFSSRGGAVRAFTPAKTVSYENLIAIKGEEAMDGKSLVEGPVQITVFATFQIPKSWSKKRRTAAGSNFEYHTSKPDADNILKAVGDALNGIVWKDDSQIAWLSASKVYGETPGLIIHVETLR